MDWYGPTETWPRHSRAYFREALSYARAAKWWFAKFESHAFGKVVCDKDLPLGGRCEFPIFSTGSASESAARELRSMVSRCPHKPSSDHPRTAVDVATDMLNQADSLIEAAERCIIAESMKAGANELLELATAATDSAMELVSAEEENLERAVQLESASRQERDSAERLADAAGYPIEEPVEPEPLLEAADERVATAEHKLGPRSNAGRRRSQVRKRATETRARIEAIRDQLDT